MDVSVIVPTYREAENLPVLVKALGESLARLPGGYEVIVVDDNSRDGTEEACAELAQSYPLRLLVRRTERGLASAVVHGIEAARGRFLVVMDADLSHPPEAVPALVAPLRADEADFVIGSRYVAGGSTEEGWGVYRWLNSKVATLLAWPLARARDPMAGFFALPRDLFESAARLDPIGYKIGLELLVKCRCRRVVEVPIHFRNRLHGQSKLSLREQVNYLRHLLRLYRFRLGGRTARAA
jgi:dolichol-phosphate mannosyltransferase